VATPSQSSGPADMENLIDAVFVEVGKQNRQGPQQ
jgi:hypothetical protein